MKDSVRLSLQQQKMDVSDIMAQRKKVNSDGENLRDKVICETSKVIKLRVAQDAAYWDLKERLANVESAHERLQQNMQDIQMSHEALSGTYQDELRQRPDFLNKLASTREICDVLEVYTGRVRASQRRAAADREALAAAYSAAAARVQDSRVQHREDIAQSQQQLSVLADELEDSTEHHQQLVSAATEARRAAESRESAAQAQLGAADTRFDELRQYAAAEAEKAKQTNALLKQQAQCISELTQQLDDKATELKAASDAATALQATLQNQLEVDTAKLNMSEQRGDAADEEIAHIKDLLTTAEGNVSNLTLEVENLKGDEKNLEDYNAELQATLQQSETYNEELTKHFEEKKQELVDWSARLSEAQRELGETRASLESSGAETRAARAALAAERDRRAADAEAARAELDVIKRRGCAAAAAAERALAERAAVVARLMRDVSAEAEARARAAALLATATDKLHAITLTNEEQTNQLKIKEAEHNTKGKIILEMKREKECLLQKITSMQESIDNIQRDLERTSTRPPPRPAAPRPPQRPAAPRPPQRPAAAPYDPPELDVNAQQCAPTPPKLMKQALDDDLLQPFLSDSSDSTEAYVNACFAEMMRMGVHGGSRDGPGGARDGQGGARDGPGGAREPLRRRKFFRLKRNTKPMN